MNEKGGYWCPWTIVSIPANIHTLSPAVAVVFELQTVFSVPSLPFQADWREEICTSIIGQHATI